MPGRSAVIADEGAEPRRPGDSDPGFAELRALALFAGLGDDQLAALVHIGELVPFAVGDELFHEARPADHWWLLLDGTVELVRRVGQQDTVLGAMDSPGQWAGGFRAWDEHGVYMATGRAAAAGRALRVPAESLRDHADAWFPFAVHLIRGLVHTARRIESTARQRESLVALGTLAAGLAHEINNPASAATRAVSALADAGDDLRAASGRLAQVSVSAQTFAALDDLRRGIDPQPSGLDPLTTADREAALSDWLLDHGVDREWIIAPTLAAAGLDVAWCDRAATTVGDALDAGLEWIAASLATTTLLAELKESTRRISDLVAVVKTYSDMDRAATRLVDVTEGVESTLNVLAHRIPGGVAVARDYGTDVPRIEAAAGELNQVWTNLIDNALDAMAGSGTLSVSTRAGAAGVIVEIADTGGGMTPEVQAHAFDPFFTTKELGTATGLGLDLARRVIVERHGGDITIESPPGQTVLRVRLPARPAGTP